MSRDNHLLTLGAHGVGILPIPTTSSPRAHMVWASSPSLTARACTNTRVHLHVQTQSLVLTAAARCPHTKDFPACPGRRNKQPGPPARKPLPTLVHARLCRSCLPPRRAGCCSQVREWWLNPFCQDHCWLRRPSEWSDPAACSTSPQSPAAARGRL